MQVEDLHVGAVIEDLLRAVAMVVVDIEDGDALGALVEEPLRGDGGVVDVAIAAHEAGAGMVAGRAAEREGRPLATLDQGGRGQRHVIGGFDRGPGAFDEGGAGIEGIIAEQRIDALGGTSPRRPRVGQVKGMAVPSKPEPSTPARPSAGSRYSPICGCAWPRRDHARPADDRPELLAFDPRLDEFGPRRLFETRHDG